MLFICYWEKGGMSFEKQGAPPRRFFLRTNPLGNGPGFRFTGVVSDCLVSTITITGSSQLFWYVAFLSRSPHSVRKVVPFRDTLFNTSLSFVLGRRRGRRSVKISVIYSDCRLWPLHITSYNNEQGIHRVIYFGIS